MNKKPRMLVAGVLARECVHEVTALPRVHETVRTLGQRATLSGRALVQAAVISQLGNHVHLHALVDRTIAAGEVAAVFAKHGLDGEAFPLLGGVGESLLLVDPDGRFCRSAGAAPAACLMSDDAALEGIPSLEGYTAVLATTELPAVFPMRLFERARSAGVTVILYFYPFECFQEDLAPLVDLFITGQAGLAALSGKPVEHLESATAAAHVLDGLGFRRAAVTLGPHGALVVSEEGMEVVPTHAVTARNLSLGADAFTGAFSLRLAEGAGLREAAAFANATASLSIPQLAIGDGLPERSLVEARARELLLGRRLPMDRTLSELHERADRIRALILTMLADAGSGHPGGSLSAAEIMAVLYFHVMRVNPEQPAWEARDRFVLSKGHAAPVLYATLALRGFFPIEELATLRRIGSHLQGHPDRLTTPGVDVSTGSLGQGLSVACGLAQAARVQGAAWRTFVLLGDGELEEGQVWEAAMSASGYRLGNLTAIVDYNGLQIDGSVSRIKGSLEPLAEKWRAFGWRVEVIGGHDIAQLVRVLGEDAPGRDARPTMVIAHTIKGKGVSFMERIVDYHGNRVSPEDCARALAELDGQGGSDGHPA